MICQHYFLICFHASTTNYDNNIKIYFKKKISLLISLVLWYKKKPRSSNQCGGCLTLCLVCRQTNRKNVNEKEKSFFVWRISSFIFDPKTHYVIYNWLKRNNDTIKYQIHHILYILYLFQIIISCYFPNHYIFYLSSFLFSSSSSSCLID